MAFDQDNFAPVGAITTASPSVYSYKTTDTKAQVSAADYFTEKSFQLEEDDVILTQASDGFGILVVGSDTSSAGFTNSTPANEIVINKEADFPEQDATTITLQEGMNHFIGAAFTTAKRFIVEPDAQMSSGNVFGPLLTYSGTGDMFTGGNGSFCINSLHITCPNASAIFNWDDTTPLTSLVNLFGLTVIDAPKYGVFNDILGLIIGSSGAVTGEIGTGIEMTGTIIGLISLNKVAMTSTSSSFVGVDLGTTVFVDVEFADLILTAPASAVGISGAASSANIATGSVATAENSNFAGGMTPLSGISNADVRWSFNGNAGIPDTNPDSLISLTSNATETTIATVDTPVLVAGTWVVQSCSHYTCTTGGRATYNGERDLNAPVTLQATIMAASGTNKDITMYLAVNGSVVAAAKSTNRVGQNDPRTLSVPWQVSFEEGDYVEIFVENNSDSINLIVVDAILRIR